MSALFLQGNAKLVLRGLPADYFHCVVTSPPYFGLRKYSGGEEIWGGDDNCQHEWTEKKKMHNGRGDAQKSGKFSVQEPVPDMDVIEHICSKCGAWRGQLGGEPTPDLYIQHLIEIMREVRRVLRPDGVFWLNCGDSWAANRSYQVQQTKWQGMDGQEGTPARVPDGCKPLDMVLIPEQLALAARTDGWYVRSIVIWAKGVSCSDEFNGNPMPESVDGWRWIKHKVKVFRSKHELDLQRHASDDGIGRTTAVLNVRRERGAVDGWQDCPGCPKCLPNDGYVLRKGSWRPTDSYEHILMLTKTNSYYCDREAVLERGVYPAGESRSGGNGHKSLNTGSWTTEGLHNKDWNGNGGRNLRSVWEFPTTPGKFKHYAAFPPRLPELCIKSSTSEKGCCPKCGSPWARVVDKGFTAHDGDTATDYPEGTNANRLALLRQAARQRGSEYSQTSRDRLNENGPSAYHSVTGQGIDYAGGHGNNIRPSSTIGWLPTCTCDIQSTEPCRVLDPFSGAGTTSLVCERLGLDSIGIDTSAEYIKLSEDRIADDEQKRVDEQIKQLRKDAKESLAKKAVSEGVK